LDCAGIPISTAASGQEYPSVAYDGANYLVVWDDHRSGICGARVSPAGSVLDPAGIPISALTDGAPKVTFDGTNYVIVWDDFRGSSSADIYGARVTPAGTVLDTFLVIVQPEDQQEPALCSGPGGRTFLVYSGWATEEQGKWYNIFRIWGKLGPFGGVDEGERRTPGRIVPYDGPTILHGILHIPQTPVPGPNVRFALLDITGRRVAELHPGENDVSRVASGVYFVRRTAAREPGSIAKVVIQ
jgi:hypothetical protein